MMHKFTLTLILSCIVVFAKAQHTITGKVAYKKEGQEFPAEGAVIDEVDAAVAVADQNGFFTLTVHKLPAKIRVFYANIQKEIAVQNTKSLYITYEGPELERNLTEFAYEDKLINSFHKASLSIGYIADVKNSAFKGGMMNYQLQSLGKLNVETEFSASFWQNEDRNYSYSAQLIKKLKTNADWYKPHHISLRHSNFRYPAQEWQFNKSQLAFDFGYYGSSVEFNFDLGVVYYRASSVIDETQELEKDFVALSIGASPVLHSPLGDYMLTGEVNLHPKEVNYQVGLVKDLDFLSASINASYLRYFKQDYILVGIRKTLFSKRYYCCKTDISYLGYRY